MSFLSYSNSRFKTNISPSNQENSDINLILISDVQQSETEPLSSHFSLQEVPSIDSSGTSKHNGIEDVNTAEAETGEDENMEIDTECTSSQARMIVSESPAS